MCVISGFLWGVDLDGANNNYDIWKLQLSDDAITEISDTNAGTAINNATIDLTPTGDALPTLWFNDNGTIYAFDVTGDPPVEIDNQVAAFDLSFSYYGGVGNTWILGDDTANDDIYMLDLLTGTISVNDSIADYSLPTRVLQVIWANTIGLLYFILNKDGDGLNYLCTYNTTTDIIIDTGIRLDVVFETYGYVVGTANSPFEFQKGYEYDTNSPSIYYISERGIDEATTLIKIGDPLGAAIKCVGILDLYLIDSDKNVWKYTESIADLHTARASYQSHRTPKGRFSHAEQFSTDQSIEIWQNTAGTYLLCFRGKMGTPVYDQRRGLWNYAINNMGFDDLKGEVSYVATAAGIDEVVIALFGQLTNPYLYVDVTSVPNIATTMTYTFDKEPLKDALYVCAILGNAFPSFEPNGYSYFRAYSNADPTGWYYGSPDNPNLEAVGTSGTDINWVDLATLPDTTTALIVAELNNHKNVIGVSHAGVANPSITHNFPNGVEITGIREWWQGSSNTGLNSNTYFRDSTTQGIRLRTVSDKIYHYPNNVQTDTGATVADNILNHIKVSYDCSAGVNGEYELWVDEVQIGAVHEMAAACTNFDNILFLVNSAAVYTAYLDAWGDPADSKYVTGYNLHDTHTDTAGNMGNPKVNKHQAQFNDFSNVRGGWDDTTSKPFAPTSPLIEEHIQQYGKKLWKGRKIFSGAINQASIDAIVAGLKAWQGMVSNPVDASFKMNQHYYPVGRTKAVQFTLNNLIPTLIEMLIVGNLTNFKRPNLIDLATSTNIVRRS